MTYVAVQDCEGDLCPGGGEVQPALVRGPRHHRQQRHQRGDDPLTQRTGRTGQGHLAAPCQRHWRRHQRGGHLLIQWTGWTCQEYLRRHQRGDQPLIQRTGRTCQEHQQRRHRRTQRTLPSPDNYCAM